MPSQGTHNQYDAQADKLQKRRSFVLDRGSVSDGFDRDGREWCHFGDKDPMWPGPFFYTEESHPWIRTVARIQDDGSREYTTVHAITSIFARLLKKTKINAPSGAGFYPLRRTTATLAARSGDPFAVQRLLGQVNLEMVTRYVQDVSAQRDRVIENSREYLAGGRSVA